MMLTYCESMAALGACWHIRQCEPEERKFSGGVNAPALCGVKIAWDIREPLPTTKNIPDCAKACCRFIVEKMGLVP